MGSSTSRVAPVVHQLVSGFRASVDSILLSRSLDCKNGTSLLDVGCGVGTASIYAAFNRENVRVTAIDINRDAIELAKQNYAVNSVVADVICADISKTAFLGERFDYVITNPPFFQKHEGRVSLSKGQAKHEDVQLSTWIAFCTKHLKPKGVFAIIHLPERLYDILQALPKYVGGITVTPIAFKHHDDAKRIILTAQHSSSKKLIIRQSLLSYNN